MIDIITCVKFGDCIRLRDVSLVRGIYLPSPTNLRFRLI